MQDLSQFLIFGSNDVFVYDLNDLIFTLAPRIFGTF